MGGVLEYLPEMLRGLALTLEVSFAALAFGLTIGVGAAVWGTSEGRYGPRLVFVYTAVARCLPELLIIFILFYGGSVLLTAIWHQPVDVSAFGAGTVALGLVFGAYAAEILRSAILAVPRGQNEAAQTLGLSSWQTWWLILFPQVVRRALPGLGNQWLVLLKDSSLVSVVGLEDLLRKSSLAAAATRDPLTSYIVAGVLYLAITTLFLIGSRVATSRRAPQS